MTLTAIMCHYCGRPTGEVVDRDEQQSLTIQQQTCGDCAGYEPDTPDEPAETRQAYACSNCGGGSFQVTRRYTRTYGATIELVNHSEVFAQAGEPLGVYEQGAFQLEGSCRNCGDMVDIDVFE